MGLLEAREKIMRPTKLAVLVLFLFCVGVGGAYVIATQPTKSQTEGKALIGGPFSLVDTDGKRVTDRDLQGKLMLVFFGYTHCPDVCPTELQTMAEVIDKLGSDADKVAPVFISVDPSRDTPQALSAYVKNFSPRIVGLTGDASEVASVAKAYRVYFRKNGDSNGEYTVDHSAFVYLMDGQGNYLTHFPFDTTSDIMTSVIKKHIVGDKGA
jgi:protein SCO1